MTGLRLSAAITLLMLVAYYVLRALASRCTGLQCDWFIPASLLLPVLVVMLVAITGLLAISVARSRRQLAWTTFFVAGTVLGVLGPPVSLLVLRDNPDAFVAVATILVAVVPLSALGYSLVVARPEQPTS